MAEDVKTAGTEPAPAAAAPAEVKPAEVVAEVGKPNTAETASGDDTTLLGGADKEDGKVAPEERIVPEKYDLKPPEGMTVDAEVVDKMTPILQKLKLTNAEVQELFTAYADVYNPKQQARLDQQRAEAVTEFNTMAEEWKQTSIKELGPDYQKGMASAAKLIDKFGGDGLRQLFEDTKVGNHPEMVKFFVKLGREFSQDSFPDSGKKGTGLETDEAKAGILFPSSK